MSATVRGDARGAREIPGLVVTRGTGADRATMGYLLAEVAGIFEGTSEGELDEPLAQQAPTRRRPRSLHWVEERRRRAVVARMRPHSGQPAADLGC
jgi:hypothetical protein